MSLTISANSLTWTGTNASTITFGPNTTTFTGAVNTSSIVTYNYPPVQPCHRRGVRRVPTEKKRRRKTPAIEVYRLDEGYFVRGTTDHEEVKRLLADDDYILDDAPEDVDWEVELDVIRTGRFRFVPCPPNGCGEHGWHLHMATRTGPGTFEGVHCDAVAREIEFAIDTITDDDLAWLDA